LSLVRYLFYCNVKASVICELKDYLLTFRILYYLIITAMTKQQSSYLPGNWVRIFSNRFYGLRFFTLESHYLETNLPCCSVIGSKAFRSSFVPSQSQLAPTITGLRNFAIPASLNLVLSHDRRHIPTTTLKFRTSELHVNFIHCIINRT